MEETGIVRVSDPNGDIGLQASYLHRKETLLGIYFPALLIYLFYRCRNYNLKSGHIIKQFT
jgi:hypothetical protein